MIWKKPASVFLFVFIFSAFTSETSAQLQRPRIVQTGINSSSVLPVTAVQSTPNQRPSLTNQVVVSDSYNKPSSLVKKTALSTPTNPIPNNYAAASQNASVINQRLIQAMNARLGIRYVYGADGPNKYDCSGLVWSVFQDAGIRFERTSARNYWQEFTPVFGEDRFKFGTLVFFNDLGHVGIVVDDKGFYQASSSKGVTYSPFAGYWEKRIVGFRRIPAQYFQ